jgi:hypothetical protein
MMQERFIKGLTALLAGCAVNYFGDRLLDVRIELFYGLQTFSFLWVLDMFALPFIVGLVTGAIFGMGGKWLCYFPPLIVRVINYAVLSHSLGSLPPDASLIPLGWWGFFVILVMEAAAFGGIAGEIVIRGTYGRSAPGTIYKKQVDDGEGDS